MCIADLLFRIKKSGREKKEKGKLEEEEEEKKKTEIKVTSW